MALDTLEKRHGVIGTAFPWMVVTLPIATPDQQWRMSIAGVYGGNALSPSAAVVVERVVQVRLLRTLLSMHVDVLVGVAEAIKVSLNTGTYIDANGHDQQFSRQFTAERHYLTPFTREKEGLKVAVMPSGIVHELSARNSVSQDTLRIHVGIQDEVDPGNLHVIDELMTFASEVKTHIRNATMPYLETENITLIAVEHDPIWDPEHLRDQSQFRTKLTFVFREAGRI